MLFRSTTNVLAVIDDSHELFVPMEEAFEALDGRNEDISRLIGDLQCEDNDIETISILPDSEFKLGLSPGSYLYRSSELKIVGEHMENG